MHFPSNTQGNSPEEMTTGESQQRNVAPYTAAACRRRACRRRDIAAMRDGGRGGAAVLSTTHRPHPVCKF